MKEKRRNFLCQVKLERAFKEKDEKVLVEKLYKIARYIANKKVFDPGLRPDAVQFAVIRMWKKLHLVDQSKGKVFSYLYSSIDMNIVYFMRDLKMKKDTRGQQCSYDTMDKFLSTEEKPGGDSLIHLNGKAFDKPSLEELRKSRMKVKKYIKNKLDPVGFTDLELEMYKIIKEN